MRAQAHERVTRIYIYIRTNIDNLARKLAFFSKFNRKWILNNITD